MVNLTPILVGYGVAKSSISTRRLILGDYYLKKQELAEQKKHPKSYYLEYF